MSEKLNIEKLFNSRLGEAEVNPSTGAWEGIQRKLRWKQFLRFRPGQFNVFYLGGLLLTGAAIVTMVSSNPIEEENSPSTAEIAAAPSRIINEPVEIRESVGTENNPGETIARETKTGNQKTKNDAIQADLATGQEAGQPESSAIAEENHTSDDPSHSPGEILQEQNTVVTYFTSSVQSGCAPLAVKFINQSVNESDSYWTIGTHEKITERDPVYEFMEPGLHTVVLTTESSEGQIFTHHQVIEVFPSPKADFEIEEGLDGIDGLEALSFMNYSAGAFSYSWNLVENKEICSEEWASNEFQPSVSIADVEQEVHYIRLLATNEYGCTDTSIQALPFSSGPYQPDLQYPTAFSPNPNGPGGGIYSPHEIRNDLFHPVFEAEPDEYLLTVFSRNGELVFKTRDLYQGWDGYYQQEQTSGGVYLWIAEGKWSNGEDFRIRGDVTLLWGE